MLVDVVHRGFRDGLPQQMPAGAAMDTIGKLPLEAGLDVDPQLKEGTGHGDTKVLRRRRVVSSCAGCQLHMRNDTWHRTGPV